MPVVVLVFVMVGLLVGEVRSVRAVSPEPDAAAAGALVGENPYQVIASRNVFALKPPPPPPDPNAAPPPDLPQIKLQGISSLFGRRQVLIKLVEKAKPGQQGREEALILKEGERYRDVEVVAINPTTGTVRFNNHGTEVEMTMDKDAEKAPTGPPPPMPAAAPAVAMARPGTPPQPMPVPTAGPNAPPPPIASAGVVHAPAPGAAPGVVGSPASGAPGAVVSAPGTAPGIVLAAGGGPGGQQLTPSPPQPPPLSREEQEVIIEINRLRYQQEGDPRAKLLPPTSLTPHLQQPPPAPY
ncbi:MAG: hypothetical protein N3I86_12635 [Verrucomicrobiae bacterium]|nr:hypothetical protein [Verrucomicrobiae bacterium]